MGANGGRVLLALLSFALGLAVLAFLLRRTRFLRSVPQANRRRGFWTYPFRTGDLVLTSRIHDGQWLPHDTSVPVKMFTESPFNHTAIAVVDEVTGETSFWELNGSGTRMATPYDMVAQGQRIYVRPINSELDARRVAECVADLWDTRFDFVAWSQWAARKAGLGRRHHHHHMRTGDAVGERMTCARLTAETYHMLGVFDLDKATQDTRAVFAADFAREEFDPTLLPLVGGYGFAHLVELVTESEHQ